MEILAWIIIGAIPAFILGHSINKHEVKQLRQINDDLFVVNDELLKIVVDEGLLNLDEEDSQAVHM